MVERARAVSLVFRPGELPTASQGFADVLARHLVGRQLRAGQRVALPGWPRFTVESVDPPGGEVGEGTEVEVTVPPSTGEGPLHLAIVVDASLTMGTDGEPTAYQRAASLIDAFLMNGRSFLASAGIVVQGGETRHIEELASPETLSGAVIHRVEPKGTFDPSQGLDRALDLLEVADEGPRAIVLVTDGDLIVEDPLGSALHVARAGAHLFAVAERGLPALDEACRHTGGQASADAESVFDALAQVAGARGRWRSPPDPAEVASDPEFETVIETMEDHS
ncbi:hypothetical protein BRD56_02035 [Thermoplasmatales archaeon SW_10_69_26]|jgi:hypothetical protein|nr:MAG: hypothetical protein BRD56_02035 [Thermoplasmatales archaeon SW_10_69_26]